MNGPFNHYKQALFRSLVLHHAGYKTWIFPSFMACRMRYQNILSSTACRIWDTWILSCNTTCMIGAMSFDLQIICPTHYLSYRLFVLKIICPIELGKHNFSCTSFVLHIICPTHHKIHVYINICYILFILT